MHRGVLFAAAMLAAAAGCASNEAQNYSNGEPRAVQTAAYGTVESVRPVHLPDDKPGESIFAGAAIGGLLGEGIGNGLAGALIGTIGGGIAGNEVHRRYGTHDGQEIVIRLDDGSALTVVQPGMPEFEHGQRVQVLKGPKGSWVSPA
jgi:outer membrane lipoprotein SlyB